MVLLHRSYSMRYSTFQENLSDGFISEAGMHQVAGFIRISVSCDDTLLSIDVVYNMIRTGKQS